MQKAHRHSQEPGSRRGSESHPRRCSAASRHCRRLTRGRRVGPVSFERTPLVQPACTGPVIIQFYREIGYEAPSVPALSYFDGRKRKRFGQSAWLTYFRRKHAQKTREFDRNENKFELSNPRLSCREVQCKAFFAPKDSTGTELHLHQFPSIPNIAKMLKIISGKHVGWQASCHQLISLFALGTKGTCE